MNRYSMRDVERLLQLPRSTLQSLVRLGFVRPARGPRRQYLFSFQDLIILRAARALMQANIPRRRIRSSLGQLRERLPEAVPLSGLAICAVGDRVVVREGANHWQADDGQYLLGFEVSVQNGILRMIEHGQARVAAAARAGEAAEGGAGDAHLDAEDWYSEGMRLEDIDPAAAIAAYSRS
ncbi:MAG TPA: MerR family transcriptional regulator, partial [Steroidobacteraceae bacterium]|nr:MerR family transcriptional regulator [Steroidobacteraceae bacterium]